ncbi:M23 family metallopeptidase [Maledivibacter halophilus]|uniref:Murein DD-endopeptidase MepM and murein hydrolase activator NlpD, contain LysM domain n=1 Tax=Maledivibacter halophilus TaxID=36842 RepID=A0A1T5LV69_9FIRM|nr:M23 family metallopeptidase [Maledivibacter halophilus]SKC79880.1 Murein DD-endopeptidase MepM and murein hydrolase activator NlpD, contain LysM domain [Maledivibacter halophilus]
MAIGLKTAYAIAKSAISIAADEEKRKKLFLVLLIPLIVVLLILSILVYILTSPLSFITDFFLSNEENTAMKEFKAAYEDTIKLNMGQLIFNGEYPMPAKGKITSPYGYRTHPVTGKYKMHTGIDIGTAWHTEIIAIANGQIAKVGIDKGYGQYIIIKHDTEKETFYSVYAHLSKIFILPDAKVKQGEVIALEGGDPEKDPLPGISTGHHLHFEIRKSLSSRSHTNPVEYLFDTSNKEDEEGSKEIQDKVNSN